MIMKSILPSLLVAATMGTASTDTQAKNLRGLQISPCVRKYMEAGGKQLDCEKQCSGGGDTLSFGGGHLGLHE